MGCSVWRWHRGRTPPPAWLQQRPARPLSHGQRSQPRLQQNWSRAAQRRFSHSLNTDWARTLTASSRCSRDEPGLLIRASAVPRKAQTLPSHRKVTPRSRETRGELGQKMRCSLSRHLVTQFRATLGKAGTWLTAWGHAGPGQASLGARAVPHVSQTPARSQLVQRAAAAFGSDSTRYRSQEEGSVSSLLPEAPNSPVRGLTQHYL